MKKVLVLMTITLSITASVVAQKAIPVIVYEAKAKKAEDPFKPYIGVGSSLSGGVVGYNAEVGIYNEKTWFALTGASVNFNRDYFVGAKAYRKIGTSSIVDSYGFLGANVHWGSDATLGLEPGLAAVFNIGRRIAPQLSLSLPFSEANNYSVPNPALGVGINYWIK